MNRLAAAFVLGLSLAATHWPHLKADDLDMQNSMIFNRMSPDETISLPELLQELQPDTNSPPVVIGHTKTPMPPSSSFARHFAVHFVEVEVDIETGEIRLVDYLATQDSGTVLNPKVLQNQVIGGAIMGSGFALQESIAFDPVTGKMLNPGFLDYKVMRIMDFPLDPKVIFCESYDPVGPFGAKSAGEAPACAPIPAISQAVYNAIRVWLDIPMTPERVLAALEKI